MKNETRALYPNFILYKYNLLRKFQTDPAKLWYKKRNQAQRTSILEFRSAFGSDALSVEHS